MFTVWRAVAPVVTCGLAWTVEGEAETWPDIERMYLNFSDKWPTMFEAAKAPEKPDHLPWLAVLLWPWIVYQSRDDVSWLGDFERCMAWTILAERSGLPA